MPTAPITSEDFLQDPEIKKHPKVKGNKTDEDDSDVPFASDTTFVK